MDLKKVTDHMIADICQMMKALSEPTRLKILRLLHDQEMSVTEIVENVGTSQANISKHLQNLLQVNLVKTRRDGTTIFYKLADKSINQICETVCKGYIKITNQKYKNLKIKGN